MSEAREYHDVHMKMWPSTVEQLGKLQKALHAKTKTDAVKYAINVTELLTDRIKKGAKLIIEYKDGKKTELMIHTDLQED